MTENSQPASDRGELVSAGKGEGEGDQQVASDADAAVAQNGQQARQPTAGESFMSITKSLIIRAIIIYFITSFFRRPQQPAGPQGGPEGQQVTQARTPALNLFQDGDNLDLYVYISELETFTDFDDPESLVWVKEDIVYGDWTSGPDSDGTFYHSLKIPTTENIRNNGSLFVHVYFVKSGFSPNPEAGEGLYNRKYTTYNSQRLNKYKRRRYRKTSNLITGETELSEEEIMKAETMKEEVISHWHPNITVNIVHDFTQWTQGAVPPPLDEYVQFTPAADRYKPITFLNTYWNLVRDYRPINGTTEILDLTVTFQPLSLFKWQLYAAQAMKSRYECHLDFQEEQEEVKMQLFDEAKCVGLAENECPAFELVQE